VLMAACAISVAALTRFPPDILPPVGTAAWPYYAYLDVLIALGLLRDLVVMGRLHWVYARVFPAVIALQAVTNAIYMTRPKLWMDLALWLIR